MFLELLSQLYRLILGLFAFLVPIYLAWDFVWPKLGEHLRQRTKHLNQDYEQHIGFFHPFCNAAGGGERVLWAAIKATQEQYPKAACIVYTGDIALSGVESFAGEWRDAEAEQELIAKKKEIILTKVEENFNISLDRPSIHFKFLTTRNWLLASGYPYFTLLGQSLGSLRVAYDALSEYVPDVFIDTMGYSFVTAFARLLFPNMPIGAYVHYPTISTDMLSSLDEGSDHGLNAGTGKGIRGWVKRKYWHLFAQMYGWMGGQIDVVMTNSSWTKAHIQSLWSPSRSRSGRTSAIGVVFPPVSVEEIENAIEISEASEREREQVLLYIAQFRPEKNHELILNAFAQLLQPPDAGKRGFSLDPKLVLIGSIRDDNDEDAQRVHQLRRLAEKLKLVDQVEFVCNASWRQILQRLGRSTIGVNGMWNEHFGIGVVEYQAGGLICVVNDSGGPKIDIVVDFEGSSTGWFSGTKGFCIY
ncbi:asparagine-linked glycosylation protein [Lambiella insularis]|nr:asparagine-linked glycosylation protein [Lambiella insularis]